MNNKTDDWYLKNNKDIQNKFYEFTDNEKGLPTPVADYFDLLRTVNQDLYKQIENLEQTIKLNEERHQKNNETIDYVIDTYQTVIQPFLGDIKIESEKDKNTIKKFNVTFNDIKQKRRKGGEATIYRQYEPQIIEQIKLYQQSQSSFGKKMTLDSLTKNIANQIGLRVNGNTVKKWWVNYKNSNGNTIFGIGKS